MASWSGEGAFIADHRPAASTSPRRLSLRASRARRPAKLSAADPLNLVGILTPEARVPAVHTNRVLLEDGLPIAALEGGEVRRLAATKLGDEELKALLARRSLRRALQPHLRAPTAREAKALANRVVH